VYFTDSEAGAVWALAPKESKLRLLHHASPERFAYPNGIAFLPGERGLLVAHWLGLVTIELPGGRVAEVRAANDSAVSRIDGLYRADRTVRSAEGGRLARAGRGAKDAARLRR